MKITFHLFEAFLKCPTKCWLRANREAPSGNSYAEWLQVQNQSFRAAQTERLLAETPPGESARSPSPERMRTSKWRLAVDVLARTLELPRSSRRQEAHSSSYQPSTRIYQPVSQSPVALVATVQSGASSTAFAAESHLNAVVRLPSEGRGKAVQFNPIRFVFSNKLGKDDRLLLAFDAFVLSVTLGREVTVGKIIYGDNHAALKVMTSALSGEVRKRLEKIATLLSNPTSPDLVLNRHCSECEFQSRCQQKALEMDDLSLLAGMSEKERKKFHSKGIFTVTQLSYTFRARRRCKRWKSQQPAYSHALKALAIREKKVHVIGRPKIDLSDTPVYLDVEGTDGGFYYLVGIRTASQQHSIWAEEQSHERSLVDALLEFLARIPNPRLVYYGRYERHFFDTMRQRYSDLFERFPSTEKIVQESLNLVSALYAKIYFPTFGNSLKDLANYLGFAWTSAGASGLQALAWRAEWESTKAEDLKRTLIQYNAEDCEALELVATFVSNLCQENGLSTFSGDLVRVEELKTTGPPFLINKGFAALPEFKQINQAAYWDYQRLHVYVRTNKVIKKVSKFHKTGMKPHVVRENIIHPPAMQCPCCGDTGLLLRSGGGQSLIHEIKSLVHDIKFLPHGVRAWVTRHFFNRRYCSRCQRIVDSPLDHPFSLRKYGPRLRAYAIDQLVRLNIPGATIAKSLGDLFQYDLTTQHLSEFKEGFAELYSDAVAELTEKMTKGSLIHADETAARVVGKSAVVWVLASMEEVVFLYVDSREGEMIRNTLSGFGGVLVSDFYPVYDSFDCPQQKCLIHLIRDFNDDLHRFPFDLELRQIASKFSGVLKPIVETIDRRGLKVRFLAKHKPAVRRFLKWVIKHEFQSEAADKYAQRIRKNREKLFTFMSYDGVPWNNNNAENAIRAFAALRERIGALCTEKTLQEYLTLLSISETCKRRGLSFFDFLCSDKKSLEGFPAHRTTRTRARRSEYVGEKEICQEYKDDVCSNQRSERYIPEKQALPAMGSDLASPWGRFRPSSSGGMAVSSKRDFQVDRFDNVPFGRVVLAIPALMESGLWEQTTDLFPEWIDRPFTEIGMLLIASMFLSRAENVEALNRVWPEGWSELLHRDRLPDTHSLVVLANLIGENPGKAAKWQAALAAKWISDASRVRAVLVACGQSRVLLEAPAISSAAEQHRNALLAHGMVEFWFRVLDGMPMLLLSQTPSEGIRPFWKESIIPQIQTVLLSSLRKPPTGTSRESRRLTVVFVNTGVDFRLIRKLQRDGLHVLSYRFSADDLCSDDAFVEQEVEVQPGHREIESR